MAEIENMGMVPLRKVVMASIIDSYGDINRQEQLNTHWAARGLRKLYNESLPSISTRVLLKVNKNTNTAELPCDFKLERFVGTIVNGKMVPISENPDLVNDCSIVRQIEKECPRCKQDKAICESLDITETERTVTIAGTDYTETVTKKLYPNGNYYMVTITPVMDIETSTVVYFPRKEFIVNFALKPCGCLAKTTENIANVQNYCPNTYRCYYAGCDDCTEVKAGYKIFEEIGRIQLSGFSGDTIYMEYEGFMVKKGGVYMVPEVAFETLVEWTKYKSVQGKLNMTRYDKDGYYQRYIIEKRNMEKIIWRVPLQVIIDANRSLPRFEFDLVRGNNAGLVTQINSENQSLSKVVIPDSDTYIILND